MRLTFSPLWFSSMSIRFFRISLLFWLIILSASLPSHADSPIVLRVGGAGGFHLPDSTATDPKSRADRAIVQAFELAHPNIRLERAQGLQIDGPASESNLLLEFAGGSAPDVIYVNFRSSATYIGQGFLMPLDDYLKRDPKAIAHISPVIRKVLLDVGHGHVYSLPFLQVVQALYYRKDLFQEAGLDPDKPPTNWDEFYADCEKLTDQSKGRWGFEFAADDADTAYYWVNFLWSAGGDVATRNPKGQWTAAFDTPAGATALEFYKKLMTAPWQGADGKTYIGVAQHSGTMPQDRADGKVGMWFQYQSNVIANQADAASINPSLVGIAPMPAGPTGLSGNEINAYMWGISSQIKDPRVRDAAWDFIQFMGSDEADKIRTTAYVQAGLGSTVNPVALQKYGFEDYTSRNSKVWLAANKYLFAHGKPEPYGENMNQIYQLLGTPLGTIEHNPNADPHAVLAVAAREVNSKLTGYVAPDVMAHRRLWAWTIFDTLMVCLLLWGGWQGKRFWEARARRLAEEESSNVPRQAGLSTRSQITAWLFMLPALASIVLWAYYPLARGLVMAFQSYRILGGTHYIGLDNFIDIFHQPTFGLSIRNSLEYTMLNLVFGFFLPIFIALGLAEIPRGKMIYRTLYYLPAVTAGLVVTFVWKQFEDPTPSGLFNAILHFASGGHLAPIKWLNDPSWAMLGVVLPAIWASAGPGSIIYLAALKGIPDDMYEAADLDGAGIWTKIWRVTLPTLKPLILINFIGATIGAFQATANILVMTGGGPLYRTQTLGLEIFENAFMYLRFGYATAAAWMMGAMLVGFTVYYLRLLRDMRFSAARA